MDPKIILGLIVIMQAIAYSQGLRCYTCDGSATFHDEGDCGDPFDTTRSDSLLTTCDANAGEVWCRKEKTGVNNFYTEVNRGCAVQCEEQNVAYVDRVTCCQNDGCNGASSMAAGFGVAVTTICAIFMRVWY